MCHGRNQLHTLGIIYTIGVWLMCRGRNQLHTLGITYTVGVWLMCRGKISYIH